MKVKVIIVNPKNKTFFNLKDLERIEDADTCYINFYGYYKNIAVVTSELIKEDEICCIYKGHEDLVKKDILVPQEKYIWKWSNNES